MTTSTTPDVDAVVVGAGFGGIYMLHTLRDRLGLSVRAFEKGDGVGGTWYFNRYPGAKSDTEGFVYRYSFDRDLLQEWNWSTRYLDQPDVLAYLEHVVDRYGLRRDITLGTEVTAAVYDEDAGLWRVRTSGGETVRCRYLVNALGLLARSNVPALPGLDTFAGRTVHTNAWPDDLDIAGRRVGVVGTGSTGAQFIVAAAPRAAHLTVFQRSPQYNVPSGNRPVTQDEVDRTKEHFPEIWDQVRGSVVAFGFEESAVEAMSVSAQERERVFQENWDAGNGFRFMFGTFCDIATDPEANAAAAAFIRRKISEIVVDPETARKLTPTDLYAKRPICNEGYYETFNRDDVELVSIRENPIAEVTPAGVRTADGVVHELDVVVLATGFDAVDGNYRAMDLRGRGGRHIDDHWTDGPSSYLGVSTAGFPNMFMILGPNGPFTNLPPSIEAQVEWIGELIGHAERSGIGTIEPTAEAERGWSRLCREIADATLFPKADSWIFGANIPGKPNAVMFYMAGHKAYRKELSTVARDGYRGFAMHGSGGSR
ncbi:flavin-containing monooxygenase [Pseudonocardia alni]|uniref:Cation diffusion facilitator CzcD-associated flavoprotein CzcO n=1 Tax=Pseudonocardia alni TaxID=33907 RepID=A0AA44ULD5_PSEA5|nr:NAD(P)/FAD-dependent oxidoreductase [Pseudonocardia alni]PKB29194.1 cation diffusion facilitator CzcD-associated flavoprotein CzcO [Pseudonocardia alni]